MPVNIEEPLFAQIYRQNENGSYSLTINPQQYPKFTEYVRSKLSAFDDVPIITVEKAHKLLVVLHFNTMLNLENFY